MLRRILLVDDSEGEALLVKQKLRDAGLDDPIYWLEQAQQAMAYLAGEAGYADRARHPLPELVLLDLGMPGIDGFQFLKWMRQQPALAGIVVIALTGEMNPKRIQMAYSLGANSFLAKNAGIEEFRNFVEFFRTFARLSKALPDDNRSKEEPGLFPLEADSEYGSHCS